MLHGLGSATVHWSAWSSSAVPSPTDTQMDAAGAARATASRDDHGPAGSRQLSPPAGQMTIVPGTAPPRRDAPSRTASARSASHASVTITTSIWAIVSGSGPEGPGRITRSACSSASAMNDACMRTGVRPSARSGADHVHGRDGSAGTPSRLPAARAWRGSPADSSSASVRASGSMAGKPKQRPRADRLPVTHLARANP
jgi:hypothetical protein